MSVLALPLPASPAATDELVVLVGTANVGKSALFGALLDSSTLLQDALREKVAFVPGASFYPDGGGEECFRLNFSYCRPEVIAEGIRRLGGVVRRHVPGARAARTHVVSSTPVSPVGANRRLP